MQPAISPQEYFRQCEYAAYSSRLFATTLDPREQELLPPWASEKQQTDYLHIRNGILRLWHRNPLIIVTREEALQHVRHGKQDFLVIHAHEWLVRNGYINFGCVDLPMPRTYQLADGPKRKSIVIIGAGVAGLSCARQLSGLCAQFRERWNAKKPREPLPKITILEGRKRVGGRVYSHPFSSRVKGSQKHGLANTAEMGAQIITGFDAGNPLDAIVRGQLALEHHYMRPDMILYDHDGSPVEDVERDSAMDRLFNDILESASSHSWKKVLQRAAEVKPVDKGALAYQAQKVNGFHGVDGVNGLDSMNGVNDTYKVSNMPLTLGAMMDKLVIERHRKGHGPLHPLDMRLLNWHYANLEYANAANVHKLSLGGWDQDGGNEFEGRHSQVIGGYSQVPMALLENPTPLDVRLDHPVRSISYGFAGTNNATGRKAAVETEDGYLHYADHVVVTVPLGVLKQESIAFKPPLPDWKRGAINRLGFGLLNKVILVFDQVFWDIHRDMFGLLNQPTVDGTTDFEHYAGQRGKAYLFWNTVKMSGRPSLVALMAGDAAEQAEKTPDKQLITDVVRSLYKIFKPHRPPTLVEAIVTRWRQDPFARGSYSYIAPAALPGDYDAMAHPVENLFFAGEATCITHPATVHGAYLSGLRAASQVLDALIGPMAR